MRPAVSISFCRPVKNGWQDEQISTRMSPLCVERVLKVWPQAQMTLIGCKRDEYRPSFCYGESFREFQYTKNTNPREPRGAHGGTVAYKNKT